MAVTPYTKGATNMSQQTPTPTEIAERFRSLIAADVPRSVLVDVDAKNKADDNVWRDHIHNIVDANWYMCEAISQTHIKAGLVFGWNPDSQEQSNLFYDAWVIAIRAGYASTLRGDA